jgi:hypothetical protein
MSDRVRRKLEDEAKGAARPGFSTDEFGAHRNDDGTVTPVEKDEQGMKDFMTPDPPVSGGRIIGREPDASATKAEVEAEQDEFDEDDDLPEDASTAAPDQVRALAEAAANPDRQPTPAETSGAQPPKPTTTQPAPKTTSKPAAKPASKTTPKK